MEMVASCVYGMQRRSNKKISFGERRESFQRMGSMIRGEHISLCLTVLASCQDLKWCDEPRRVILG